MREAFVKLFYLAFASCLFAASVAVAADKQVVADTGKKEILVCDQQGENPCTVESPCSGNFTYCATDEQCYNALSEAQKQQSCIDTLKKSESCCIQSAE